MPRTDTQVPAITVPAEDTGTENSGPSHVTRSVSKAARAAKDISNDHSNLETQVPQEQRGKKERGRKTNRPSTSLVRSKSRSSASKRNPKKKLGCLRTDTSLSRSRSKNSAERRHTSPNVAERVAEIEERENNKRKQTDSTPTKSPVVKRTPSNQRPTTMAGDELPKVPAFDPPDRAGKDQRPPTYARERVNTDLPCRNKLR